MKAYAGQPHIPDLPPQPDLRRGRCATAPADRRAWWTSGSQWQREAARHACLACPVLDACRAWGLSLPAADTATYGGLTHAERLAAKRAARTGESLAS